MEHYCGVYVAQWSEMGLIRSIIPDACLIIRVTAHVQRMISQEFQSEASSLS